MLQEIERVVEPVEQSFLVLIIPTVLCLSSVEPILDPKFPIETRQPLMIRQREFRLIDTSCRYV